MITLNTDALMRLTYAAVPALVDQGRGSIVNIASILAITPETLNGFYGATKAFVLAFSQSLRHELAGEDRALAAWPRIGPLSSKRSGRASLDLSWRARQSSRGSTVRTRAMKAWNSAM